MAILLGTVIRATQLNRDLIPAFATELHRISPDGFKKFVLDRLTVPLECSWLYRAITEPGSVNPPTPDHAWWHTDFANIWAADLVDALTAVAPRGYYFGTNPGDSSDYGWWAIEDQEEEAPVNLGPYQITWAEAVHPLGGTTGPLWSVEGHVCFSDYEVHHLVIAPDESAAREIYEAQLIEDQEMTEVEKAHVLNAAGQLVDITTIYRMGTVEDLT